MMFRRDFLKFTAGLLSSLIVKPLPVFIPPREPYVRIARGLDGLVSHLGVLPSTKELCTCEGSLLEIEEWDGVGYPCLVQNACTFGPEPPRAIIYDFDLWNFRHDDEFGPLWKRDDFKGCKSHREWHARRRFGSDYREIVTSGGGVLFRHLMESEAQQ